MLKPYKHFRTELLELWQELIPVVKWPSLEDRRRNNVFKLVKKCIRERCPQYFKDYFKCNHGNVHQRATRQKNELHIPAVRIETAKRSFYYYCLNVFNSFMQ